VEQVAGSNPAAAIIAREDEGIVVDLSHQRKRVRVPPRAPEKASTPGTLPLVPGVLFLLLNWLSLFFSRSCVPSVEKRISELQKQKREKP
jgi:hypothetical protein